MTRKFTAAVIAANVVLVLALFVSSLSVLWTITSYSRPVIVTGFDAFSVYLAYAQTSNEVVPAIAWGFPNYPVYVLFAAVVVNLVFVVKLLTNKEKPT